MVWDKKLHKERNQKAVKLVLDEGYAPAEIALRFDINVKQIYNLVGKEKQRRKLKEGEMIARTIK